MPNLTAVQDKVEAVAAEGRLPVVVFDLDSTLFNTAGRNLVILQEFAKAHGQRFAFVPGVIANVEHSELGWSITGPFRRRGFDDPAMIDALAAFWKERFFTDEYVLHDLAAPGSVAFVRGVHERGALVYYLTGRHVGDMEVGTVRSLTAAGFPLWRGRTVLHLKPDFHLADEHFKQQALRDIQSHKGEVVATFENEPGNAHLLKDAFPGAWQFLYGKVRSPEAPDPHPELIEIEDFHV